MIQKITFSTVVLLACNAFASKGVHITYDINTTKGQETSHGTAEYFFQDGNMLAKINFGDTMGSMVFLENHGKRYSLFPKDKTYINEKEGFSMSLSSFQPPSESGTFQTTGEKKIIAGYKCQINRKETPTSITSVCVSKTLYKEFKDLLGKLESNPGELGGIKGFPLENVSLITGASPQKTSIVVRSIGRKNYQDRFEIPKDYTKKVISDQPQAKEMLNQMQNGPMDEKQTEEIKKKYNMN